MTESVRPKWASFKYATMLVGALAVAASALAFAAPVSAKPNTGPSWDIEAYDDCVKREVPKAPGLGGDGSWAFYYRALKTCCLENGGVWQDSSSPRAPEGAGKCVAPSGSSQGPPVVGGHDLTDLPQVTVNPPPRPIQVPSDIATVSAESQAPA